ncbi:hypothetical protein L208DRAFT_1395258 [Tricholoma matsutake]|nr:hypothetical protein L208DRAFT_1395258 [Tricholoma matsutake 945]
MALKVLRTSGSPSHRQPPCVRDQKIPRVTTRFFILRIIIPSYSFIYIRSALPFCGIYPTQGLPKLGVAFGASMSDV